MEKAETLLAVIEHSGCGFFNWTTGPSGSISGRVGKSPASSRTKDFRWQCWKWSNLFLQICPLKS